MRCRGMAMRLTRSRRLLTRTRSSGFFWRHPGSMMPTRRRSFAKPSLPKHVVNFVLVTIDKRRQRLLRSIAAQYHALLDAHMGRAHVQVTVARPTDDATKTMIAEKMSAILGMEAIPHVRVDPGIIGGLVVRTGDTIYDGSIRRRLDAMRRRLLQAPLPAAGGAAEA
ncbi:MAG: ATP synthase F1 subunit delta [Longimicrobiales bacterium]